ncbi:putative pre-mRNA-processing factor 19 [Cryptosporidium felis]|nr:putative pre-mRNA-processing factor 19 [Cryptosporidium felis]
MAFVCSISGAVPEDPVVSKTGYVFERRLIEEYIRCNNSCPVTKSELSLEDLVKVKSPDNLKPRLIRNASIPGILDSLRTEWDSLMLETFQLRSELEQTKAQLTHSLYQHDAACRVIARISRERDEALGRLEEALKSVSERAETESQSKKARVDENFVDVPKELGALLEDYSERMRPIRKKQAYPGLKGCDEVGKFVLRGEFSLNADSKLKSGFFFGDQVHVSGLESGEILISRLDREAGDPVSTSSPFSTRIRSPNLGAVVSVSAAGANGTSSSVPQIPSQVFASFQDSGKIHVFSGNPEGQFQRFEHSHLEFGPSPCPGLLISGLEVHPLDTLLIANSQNRGAFSMFDLKSGKQLFYHSLEPNLTYSDLKVHPDGLILGGISPSGNAIDMWDIRSLQKISTLEASPIAREQLLSCLCFSNNGYYLFSTSTDCKVHLWDLRKSSVLDSLDLTASFVPNSKLSLKADLSGKYVSHFSGTRLSVFSLFSKHKLAPTCSLPIPDSELSTDESIQDVQLTQNLSRIYSVHHSGVVRMWTDT